MNSTPRNLAQRVTTLACVLLLATFLVGVGSAQQPGLSVVADRYNGGPVAPGNVSNLQPSVGGITALPDTDCFIPKDSWPLTVPECGVTLFANGVPIPIGRIFGQDGLQAYLPPNGAGKLAPGPVEFVIQVGDETSEPLIRNLAKFHPVITWNFQVSPLDGLSFGEFRRTNSFLITRESAAEQGEALTIQIDGIGGSTPPVPPGMVGPVDPPAVANVALKVTIEDGQKVVREAQVLSTTVSTTHVGFYDLTFVVPSGLPEFDNYSFRVEIEDGNEVFASNRAGLAVGLFKHEVTGVLDAAGFRGNISPGALASVFGLFATKDIAADRVPLNLEEDGLSITFDGLPAGILSVNRLSTFDQANVHVPTNLDVTDGKVDVQVHFTQKGGQVSEIFEVDAAAASPGIYTFDPTVGQAIVQNVSLGDDDVVNGSFAHVENSLGTAFGEQPAAIDGIVTIWANGLGPVSGVVGTGDVPGLEAPLLVPTKEEIRVFFDGMGGRIIGTPVLHPTLVGTFQINVRVPDTIVPGPTTQLLITVKCGEKFLNSQGGVHIATRAKP